MSLNKEKILHSSSYLWFTVKFGLCICVVQPPDTRSRSSSTHWHFSFHGVRKCRPKTHTFAHSRTCLHTPVPKSCKVTVPAAHRRWSSCCSSVCLLCIFCRTTGCNRTRRWSFSELPVVTLSSFVHTFKGNTGDWYCTIQQLLNSPTWRWLNHDKESRDCIFEFGQAGNVIRPHHVWKSSLEVSHVLLNPSWFTQT